MKDIKQLMVKIHANARAKGFWDQKVVGGMSVIPKNKGEMIALMHSELSEALEAVREPGPDKHLPHLDAETVEMADTIIRILDYCEYFKLPITEAIKAKMEFNASRPHMHGKRF